MVYEYELKPYPRKLWVTLSSASDVEDFEGLTEMDESCKAGVDDGIMQKSTKQCGIFVRFTTKSVMTASTMAHEAVHVANNVWNYIGANVDPINDEPSGI